MTVEKIQVEIESLIAMGPDLEKERPKVEFKSKWTDLKSDPGVSEFLKDVSAMANTVGLDGFLIFGYDPKADKYHQVSFKDSNLQDQSEIRGILTKGLSEPFDIELYSIAVNSHHLDVLHIPPSVNKPHVIKLHRVFKKEGMLKTMEENRILVRKNGGIYPATKYDIDFMYYDRKNIIPEYEAFVSVNLSKSSFYPDGKYEGSKEISARVPITIENTGRRPFFIEDVHFSVSLFDDEEPARFETILIPHFKKPTIPLKSQELFRFDWMFRSQAYSNLNRDLVTNKIKDFEGNKKYLILKEFLITTSSGERISPKLRKC